VEAGYNATFDDMVRLDLRYIREQSTMLDFKIMLKTVGVVLRSNGAG
jgi:lipopolysaccharide/colanic/teichoic acid biosynthesis glycosyltransferase